MMYGEFCDIGGKHVEFNVYDNLIEPIYMAFEFISKREMAVMFHNQKKGGAELWVTLMSLWECKRALEAPFDAATQTENDFIIRQLAGEAYFNRVENFKVALKKLRVK